MWILLGTGGYVNTIVSVILSYAIRLCCDTVELSWTEEFPHTDTSARLTQEHLNYAKCSTRPSHYHRYNGQILGILDTSTVLVLPTQTQCVSYRVSILLPLFIFSSFSLKCLESQTGTSVARLGLAIFQARLYFG